MDVGRRGRGSSLGRFPAMHLLHVVPHPSLCPTLFHSALCRSLKTYERPVGAGALIFAAILQGSWRHRLMWVGRIERGSLRERWRMLGIDDETVKMAFCRRKG